MTSTASIREQKFIEHFAEHNNATQAAIYAGYAKNSAVREGYRLKNKPSIKKEIDRIKAGLAKKSKWTREKAIERLESIEQKALEDERPNYSAAVKAIETISKLVGLFPEEKKKVELEGDLGVVIKNTITFGDLQNAKGSGN
jgi:phage terminase small subunit